MREELLVHLHAVLEQLLVHHVQQHVARDVGRVGGARRPAAPNGRWAMRPSGQREKIAPMCSSSKMSPRRLLAHDRDRVLVAEVVGALDRVVGVALGVVLGGVAERGVDAALRRARVGAHRVQLGDDGDVGAAARSPRPRRACRRGLRRRSPRRDEPFHLREVRRTRAQTEPTKQGYRSPQIGLCDTFPSAPRPVCWGMLAISLWVPSSH